VLERKPWIGEFDPLAAVVFHEHMELMPKAAE
jgi:NTE family protein